MSRSYAITWPLRSRGRPATDEPAGRSLDWAPRRVPVATVAEVDGVSFSVEGSIGRLRLDRADRRNALTTAMLEGIVEACHRAASAPVNVLLVSGDGPDFSVGFDLDELAAMTGADEDASDGAVAGARAVEAILDLEAVTVACLTGWVVGGGAALAAACDLRVGDHSARFRIPEVRLGIPLGWGAVPLLVAEIGPSATRDLVLTGRDMGAEEAHRRGLLNRLVDTGSVGQESESMGAELADLPGSLLSTTNRQVAYAADVVRTGDDDTVRLLEALAAPGFDEGLRTYRRRIRGSG